MNVELLTNETETEHRAVEDLMPLTNAELSPRGLWRISCGEDPRAAFLAFYLMEGSRVGEQHVAPHLEEALGLTQGEVDACFRGRSANTGKQWRSVKALLGELPENANRSVIRSAKAMFGFFRDGLLSATAC